MSYQGYTDYETWLTKLWLDNDYNAYQLQREWGYDALKHGDPVTYIEEELARFISDNDTLQDEASLYSDLLGAAIIRIDKREIAKDILDEIAEELYYELDEHDIVVWYHDGSDGEIVDDIGRHLEYGWYWWITSPGCLPDSEPMGPFDDKFEAVLNALDIV